MSAKERGWVMYRLAAHIHLSHLFSHHFIPVAFHFFPFILLQAAHVGQGARPCDVPAG
jgi:hypothetical protein